MLLRGSEEISSGRCEPVQRRSLGLIWRLMICIAVFAWLTGLTPVARAAQTVTIDCSNRKVQVSAVDQGQETPRLWAYDGQVYELLNGEFGAVFHVAPAPSTSPDEFEIHNSLHMGVIEALIHNNGQLVASAGGLAPGDKAVFAIRCKQ